MRNTYIGHLNEQMYFSYKSQYHNKLEYDLLNDPSTVSGSHSHLERSRSCLLGLRAKAGSRKLLSHTFYYTRANTKPGSPPTQLFLPFPSFPLISRLKAREALPKEHQNPIMKPTPSQINSHLHLHFLVM